MSHVEANRTAYESAAEGATVEALLHTAAAYQPEQPAPNTLETRVGEHLRTRRLSAAWRPRRATLPVAALASSVVAVLFWPFFSPHPTERIAEIASPTLSFVSSNESSTPGSSVEHPAQREPFTTVAYSNNVAPSKRAPSPQRRTNRSLRRQHRNPRRAAPAPTVRWQVEVVEHEVERAVTPGWWIARNETTGHLEAIPAEQEIVSAREISPSSVSCASPESVPTTSPSTNGEPETQPGSPQENPQP